MDVSVGLVAWAATAGGAGLLVTGVGAGVGSGIWARASASMTMVMCSVRSAASVVSGLA